MYAYRYYAAILDLKYINFRLKQQNSFIEFAILNSFKVSLETQINSLKKITLN